MPADQHSTTDASFPILIGGVGGSGTRLFAENMLAAGLRTMNDINGAIDSVAIALLFKRPDLLQELDDPARIDQLWTIAESAILGGRKLDGEQRDLLKTLRKVPRPMHSPWWLRGRVRWLVQDSKNPPSSGRWFMKEPNLHWPCPRLLELRPDYRFIMVVRHGVDMAFSQNQQQLIVWGSEALGEPDVPIDAVHSLRYWALVHRRFRDVQAQYPDRVLTVSFDQFCLAPERILRHILGFCEIEATPELVTKCIANVKPPKSIGRHLDEDCSIFDPEDLAFAEAYMDQIQID